MEESLRNNCTKSIGEEDTITFISRQFLQNILDLYFKYFKLSEDVVNRILQVILDLQHFKSSLLILAATILQISSAIHHLSNIDNMYIKSYSFSLFSSLPGVLTPVRGESLKILNGFDVSLPVSHSLWSSQSFGHQKVVSLVDVVLDGAFGGVGEEEVVVGDGVERFSLSLVRSTNSCFGGMIVSLIFLNPWEEEACVSMEV
ncbi:hypothetical protein Tco_0880281 [Tanacetum coccineum]